MTVVHCDVEKLMKLVDEIICGGGGGGVITTI